VEEAVTIVKEGKVIQLYQGQEVGITVKNFN
jgi:hypothetical protein